MANYVSRMRTSYFRVKDTTAFTEGLNQYIFEDLEYSVEEDGTIMLMGSGFMTMLKDEDYMAVGPDGLYLEGEEDPQEMVDYLREHMLDDEIILINAIGYENMRYLVGDSYIITKTDSAYVLAEDAVKKLAVDKGIITEEQSHALKCEY